MDEKFVKDLALWRKTLEHKKNDLEAVEASLHESPEWHHYKAALDALKVAQDGEADAAALLRETALADYQMKGIPNLPGCKIAEYTVLSYDQGLALGWCVDHELVNLLSLDKRAFEKAAKELQPDFVTVFEELWVRIDSDLSEFLTGD